MPALVIESETLGKRSTHNVSGPGGSMRFAVGSSAGRRSGVWSIEVSRNSSDIYLGHRDLMSKQKISLHESGDWRFAWTGDAGKRIVETGLSRIIDQWPRPLEAGGGWTWALDILIPASDLEAIGPPSLSKSARRAMRWVDVMEGVDLYGFHIVIAKAEQGIVKLEGFFPVDICYLAPKNDGEMEFCILLTSFTTLSSDQLAWLDEHRKFLARELEREDAPAMAAPRGILYGTVSDQRRTFWEVSVRPRKCNEAHSAL